MHIKSWIVPLLVGTIFTLQSCDTGSEPVDQGTTSNRSETLKTKIANMKLASDPHSFSKPNEARVSHLEWEAEIDFDTKIITATATYNIENKSGADKIILDTKDLNISQCLADGAQVNFTLGEDIEHLGQALEIPIGENTKTVAVQYTTAPDAGALLWVDGDSPFLFTQSQAILGRTWLPCQDSPGVRYTYNAKVKVPKNLLALMSAKNPQTKNETGIYEFQMELPIPSYLMALAVGDVEFRAIGENSGVYAVADLIDAAEQEFQEMDEMIVEAEKLYGDYVWGRYDLLILPAAFPFGGMENPMLTFATPTIIAGDKSLVALVAHELAHSWSGNLVTNSTWNDFWINEGFTVYFEQRIMEAVYGREHSEMLAKLSQKGMLEEAAEIQAVNAKDTHLKLDLAGRNPDDGLTAIAYDKGYFFLRLIEETVGREKMDKFLRGYFQGNAFKVMDTETFLSYLKENLLTEKDLEKINIDEWVYGPGIPASLPKVESDRLEKVDAILANWTNGQITTAAIPWNEWIYQERYRFINNLPAGVGTQKMAELDKAFNITAIGNNEVLFVWLKQSVENKYQPAYGRLRSFLVNVGRRKFLTPLYDAMINTGQIELAREIYKEARPNYHTVATMTMDPMM